MASEKLNSDKCENLKRQLELLSLEKQINKLLADEWRQIRGVEYNAEIEEQRLPAKVSTYI